MHAQRTRSQQVRQNRERMRNKLKSLSLKSRLERVRQVEEQEAGAASISKFSSKNFESEFTLSDKIGQGAHGVVRKCIEKSTKTVYCVKITQGDEQHIRISQKTYGLLYLVDSPHVIRPKKLFISEATETCYLVMEYVPWTSLGKLIQQNTLSPLQIHQIVKMLLETVCQLHKVGICHRDLKPDNILFDPVSGSLKLIDFGVSKLIYNRKKQRKEKMWTVTGTIHYKAPEMFEGKEYDELVDAWAIGVITYQLLYGRLPFYSEFLAELIQQISEAEPQYPESDEPEVTLAVDFMKSLLRKDSRRSTCLEALHHPWLSLLDAGNPRNRVASEDFLNLQTQFNRYRQMSMKFNGTLSPPASVTSLPPPSSDALASAVETLTLTGSVE